MRPLLLASVVCAAACGGSKDGDRAPAPTHENVAALIDRSCAFGTSCHGGEGDGQARLNFAAAARFDDALFEDGGAPRAACEYDRMPLVDRGNPDGSWIMVKLDGPVDGLDRIVPGDWGPETDWVPGTDDACPDLGQRMPQVGESLAREDIELVREWIRLGAPGPTVDAADDDGGA